MANLNQPGNRKLSNSIIKLLLCVCKWATRNYSVNSLSGDPDILHLTYCFPHKLLLPLPAISSWPQIDGHLGWRTTPALPNHCHHQGEKSLQWLPHISPIEEINLTENCEEHWAWRHAPITGVYHLIQISSPPYPSGQPISMWHLHVFLTNKMAENILVKGLRSKYTAICC